MRAILDTHTLIWFYLDDPKLSVAARAAINDLNNTKFVSPASYWEVAIKLSTGKYLFGVSFETFIQEAIFDNSFDILPVETKHASALIGLTHHHKDPFDRLIIAQAIVENVPIVSADAKFDGYPIARIW